MKFIYATLLDGVDERRDINGEIAGIARDVNRYFQMEYPGHRIRYDTFGGRLDIQHIQLPITYAGLRELFVERGWNFEDFFQSVLNNAGHDWKHGMYDNVYGRNDRYYFMFIESARGVKWDGDGVSFDYECTGGPNPWIGLGVRFLRRIDGRQCPGQVGRWFPNESELATGNPPREFQELCAGRKNGIPTRQGGMCRPWGWTLLQWLISAMMTPVGRPECEEVVRRIQAAPWNERPYALAPDTDIWATHSQVLYPLGHPNLAKLDPDHSRYFKITSGPFVGKPCYDIVHAPIWERVDD